MRLLVSLLALDLIFEELPSRLSLLSILPFDDRMLSVI